MTTLTRDLRESYRQGNATDRNREAIEDEYLGLSLPPFLMGPNWTGGIQINPPSPEVIPAAPHIDPDSVALEAARIVAGPRRNDYGDAFDNTATTAQLWNAYLQSRGFLVEINPKDVPLMMILFKISREISNHKRDNLVDIAGYADVAHMVVTSAAERGIEL